MKILVFLFSTFFYFTYQLYAQVTNTRIAYIDLDYLFKRSSLHKKYVTAYKKQQEKYHIAYRQGKMVILKKKTYLQDLSIYLGREEYLSKAKKLQEEIIQLELSLEKLHTSLVNWKKDYQSILLSEFLAITKLLAEKKGWNIIISKKKNVLYADEELDITEEIIELLNAKNVRSLLLTK